MADLRAELLSGLTGRILEVGCGDGGNFPHYPATVASVVGVEPAPYLRSLAVRAAAAAPVPVHVLAGTVDDLPAAEAAFDAGVVCLMLCSVRDPAHALGELARVIRPGGELRLLEHVAAERGPLRAVQKLMDATVWPWFAGGCHASRDAAATIAASEFTIERLRRLRFPDQRVAMPTSPHVLGAARRRPPAGERS